MYKSKLLRHEDYNLTWFWQGVRKFNDIANPNGVDENKQIPIIKSESTKISHHTKPEA